MLPEPLKIVLFQTLVQAVLALVIMLILYKFFTRYRNNYFQYWSWSWLALMINLLGSALSLYNVMNYPLNNTFRLSVSIITVLAGFLQILWLFIGSYELSRKEKINRKWTQMIIVFAVIVSVFLVLMYYSDPNSGSMRILLRVGVKSLAAGIIFITSSIFLSRRSNTGIGIKFIIFSFSVYGILQFNTFLVDLSNVYDIKYGLEIPFYVIGSIDLFLQALMGLGMIISVLEIEQDNLKKANNELDTFLYRSSHDLRAPLTTISGIVQVLKHEKEEEKKAHYLELINERVDQADNVIKDIITLRKGQKLSLNIKEIDLEKEIIKEFDSLKSPTKKMPDFQLEIKGNQIIQTDPERLHTVLTNILSNSIKYHNYNQKNPWIRVQSNRIEEGIELVISDNGAGIEAKHLSKVFEMFYRANKSSTGSGLGLYLVKDALDIMKGTIEVHSKEKIGSDFYISLRDMNHKSV